MDLRRDESRYTVYWDLSSLRLDDEKVSPMAQLGLKLHFGKPVFFNIQAGSPAEEAGVRDGDVVLAANGVYAI